jgi:hypothetical protein
MAERELSTRDLAGTSPEEASSPDERNGVDAPTSAERKETEAAGESHVADVSANDDAAEPEQGPLLPSDQSDRFVTRWQDIQASFVDEPRQSVAQADALVADLMQRLAAGFSDERQRLETQWDRGDDVSTEDLRVALRRYRAFFDRLLSA